MKEFCIITFSFLFVVVFVVAAAAAALDSAGSLDLYLLEWVEGERRLKESILYRSATPDIWLKIHHTFNYVL
jgi:hypothetical protein